MSVRLTEEVVKGLPRPTRGNRIHYDEALAGFGVRVTAAGSRSFVLNYIHRGRERRATIGSWPSWGVRAAREEAQRMRRAVDVGDDPLAARDALRGSPTVAELARRYAAEHLPSLRPKTASEYESMMRKYVVPELGALRITALTPADVRRLHDGIKATFPVRANRVVSLVAAMVEWNGPLPEGNPASGIQLVREDGRERFLSPDEAGRLCDAIDRLPDQRSADALRLLLATGARKMEVLASTWQEFDLVARTWTKPSARTKAKRRHAIPLADSAVELLASLREEAEAASRGTGPNDHVLPGTGSGGHLADVKRAWRRVTREAGLGRFEEVTGSDGRKRRRWVHDVRVHDLRHTFASRVVMETGSLPLVARLLGQSRLSSAERYSHLADEALRSAANHAGRMSPRRRDRK